MILNSCASSVASALAQRDVDRRDDVAIESSGHSVTFGECAARTAQLATSILEVDDRNTWLPVFVDRSIDSAVAILAAIHAGRPFVPIDAALPPARIEQMLTRIGSPSVAVVSRSQMTALLGTGVTAIPLDADHTSTERPVRIEPFTPGIVLFTSGSTGTPKGVVRTWNSIDRRLGDIVPTDLPVRSSHLQPLNFSGGLSKLIRIAAGETLCMIDPRDMSLDMLISWLAEKEITHARLGGGTVDALLRRPDVDRLLPTVREFSVFGSLRDWKQVPLIRRLCSSEVSVVNNYSATEIGNVGRFSISPDDEVQSGPMPNGTLPIDRLRLVDCDEGQEIWVRDPDALEYLGDPELTARRFVTDEEGVRWWRSGDLGRVDEEGYFYFTGRIDHMVKINGMRIEPGEPEHVLRSIPGITSAAVIAHPTSNGSLRLVGHVCVDDESLTPEGVRNELAKTLPSHLVPAVLVRHDELPYTDRLKLDRQALLSKPIVRWTSTNPSLVFHEQILWIASRIQEIIGLGPIAPNDDIWEAGLDSMGAVELCSIIAGQGLGQMQPVDLLGHTTAITINDLLSSARTLSSTPSFVFNGDGSRRPIFAIPGGGGTAFAFRSLADELGEDQPLIVIEPRGMHCIGRTERSISARVRTASKEISRQLPAGDPLILLGYSAGVTVAVETARLESRQGREVRLVLLDGRPQGKQDEPSCDWRGCSLHSRPTDPSLTSRGLWRLRRVRHAVKDLMVMPGVFLLRFRPGLRRYSQEYYDIFKRANRRACRRNRLRVFDSPTTLLHIEGSEAVEKCTPWFTDLSHHQVAGDHFSMLYSPQVQRIAAHVERIRSSLMANT